MTELRTGIQLPDTDQSAMTNVEEVVSKRSCCKESLELRYLSRKDSAKTG